MLLLDLELIGLPFEAMSFFTSNSRFASVARDFSLQVLTSRLSGAMSDAPVDKKAAAKAAPPPPAKDTKSKSKPRVVNDDVVNVPTDSAKTVYVVDPRGDSKCMHSLLMSVIMHSPIDST